MATERVQRKDGSYVNVIADTKEGLSEAVKAAKNANPVSTININEPVTEGHDLVVVEEDGSSRLDVQVPETALNFNPDVEQRFNAIDGLNGDSSNSAAAKAAARAKAEEARLVRGPSSDAELSEAREESSKFTDKVVREAGGSKSSSSDSTSSKK